MDIAKELMAHVGKQLHEAQKASQQVNYIKLAEVVKKIHFMNEEFDCDIYATGMGKAGHVAKKFAASMSSLGTPTFFVHPAEAHHGDLGMFKPGCIVFCYSNSGKTQEIISMVEQLKDLYHSVKIVAVTQKEDSPLGKLSNAGIFYGEIEEACHIKMAPTTSTLIMELLGNAVAIFLSKAKGFDREDFGARHHGGYLGAIAKKED